ncbi:Ankyrin repeat and BTB/POZ domain-containing protein 1 [Elasticomyces elasticus]|nr:Ankyrin repeat and BTB/POZ domain-containing protein 1 [Elasticomyces elasticus]
MAASAPPAKRAKLDFSKHFRVLVGEEQKEFIVHKDPISLRSTFFTAAASETWNAAGKPIELQEYTPNVFSDYLKCVYTDAVDIEDTKEVHTQEINHAISIYVLADYLGDCRSMNLVIDSMIQWRIRNNSNPPPVCICHLYQCTSAGSRLRRLFVDLHIHQNHPGWFEACFRPNSNSFNALVQLPEFITETLIEFARLRNEDLKAPVWKVFHKQIARQPKCHYHVHDDLCPPCDQSVVDG